MAHVTQWRSNNPYIVRVRPHPVLQDHWVLELPGGAKFSALIWFDDDGARRVFDPGEGATCAHRVARMRYERHGFQAVALSVTRRQNLHEGIVSVQQLTGTDVVPEERAHQCSNHTGEGQI